MPLASTSLRILRPTLIVLTILQLCWLSLLRYEADENYDRGEMAEDGDRVDVAEQYFDLACEGGHRLACQHLALHERAYGAHHTFDPRSALTLRPTFD
jgi:hypothetical protein